MRKFYICLIFVTFTIISDAINAAEKLIYKIDIKKEIGSTTWLYIQKGFQEAADNKSDAILIHMNTYGGEVLYADSIRTKILNSKIPGLCFCGQ